MRHETNTQFWVPGMSLDYPPYTKEHLLEDWQSILSREQDGPVIPLTDDIMGVMTIPQKMPTKLASLDLCEVLRDTHLATAMAVGKDREHMPGAVWQYDSVGLDNDVTPEVVKAVMNAGLVQPVGQISQIRPIIERWKDEGVYVIANTSTLPDCERATLEHLIAKELPGCFDGIVLPRNHRGDGLVTKGSALQAVFNTLAATLDSGEQLEAVLHIDDAPYHLKAVAKVMGSIAARGAVIMPVFEAGSKALYAALDHEVDEQILAARSPLHAFQIANDFLLS